MNSSNNITYHNKVKKTNLPKHISSKITEFIDRKISLNNFEQWIYNCDQLSNELKWDEFLKLIEFNFHSKDVYHSLDKILYELLDKYTVEETTEIVISGLKISDTAYGMLLDGKTVDSVKIRNEIKKVFEEEGVPVFDKVIDFQERFGGIWYKIGEKFYEGFRMNLFYYNDFKGMYVLNYFTKIEGRFFFQCMDYHYAGDIGPCIDEDGKIYRFAMGHLFLCADSIEEFLEDEAIKYYFVSRHNKWLKRGVNMSEINEFKKTNDFHKIERESFSGKYFEWWYDTEETIFIRIDLTRTHSYAELYCKDQIVLMKLYNADKPASIYPFGY